MRNLNIRRTCASAIAATMLISGSASASTTTTTTLSVSATVLSACLVVAVPLIFGNYDPTSSTNLDASTTIGVTCTSGANYTVGLSAGGGTGATVASRVLTSGSNTLNYTLYSNSSRSTVWGQTIGTDTVAGSGSGLVATYNVYGRIALGQSAPAGIYTDSVTVTVTY